jgi:DNA transformation protein
LASGHRRVNPAPSGALWNRESTRMSVSPSYRTFVVEQLSRVRNDIRTKNMFGGVGIYAGDLFFALIDDDLVYFKVDDDTRPAFEQRGMGPFMPQGEAGEVMQYYQVPEEVLEDLDELRSWMEGAIAVAQRKRSRSRKR